VRSATEIRLPISCTATVTNEKNPGTCPGIESATGMEKVVVSYSGGYGVHMPANGTNNVSLYLVGVINPGGWSWLAPSHLARTNGESYG